MNYYERALALKDETIAHRRYFHTNAEVGLDLPKTKAYVMEKLREYGLEPRDCGYGVTATLGKGGKVILLRADMDALPLPEESGEPFACPSGAAHACGHDFHAAMLLTAAKMLKENEAELEGTVKFMFQPAEETFEGGKDMIEHGILEDPPVDAALAYHVTTGKMPVGMYMYNTTGPMMFSVDGFKIKITGKGAHGAYPHSSIDPINIGVHIYLALEALMAREADPSKSCVMTIGNFSAGSAANIIPDTALLQGTIRTNDPAARALLVRRMKEVSVKTAEMYGGTAEIEMISEVAPLICDPKLTEEFIGYMKELNIPGMMPYPGICASASEDFATIAERVPSTFMYLSAGFLDERGRYPAHSPQVLFNEDVCPIGSSCLAHCATQWLKHNK
ncbi:M20 family metallopeptidase [Pseudoflavonifractor sp. HCP28S3_F10]|uniref:M20 family metallopeptidase n=1 Tax=Pseudoflavonifractor sp. HCP28S3_F10 TaxID=3438947 RepID=UPI003F897D9D